MTRLKGFTTAPLVPADAAAVARVWRTSEEHDDGEAMASEEDFVGAMKRPSMDHERHTIGVRDGAELVAVGMLFGQRQAFVHVLPSHRGRGIGAWLLRWTQDAGRAAGNKATCQTVTENQHAARSLLEAAGYERIWEEWFFEIGLEREPDPPRLPAGYALREFVPDRDQRSAFDVIDTAFGEWPDAERRRFEDWAAETLGRPGFAPAQVGTVVMGDEIVGVAVLIEDPDQIWVSELAVARAHRGRGLARALLTRSFSYAWRMGLRRCGLSTDARTGARGLYEHVGMHVRRTAWDYKKPL